MKKLILALLLALSPVFAATNNVTATSIFRVWSTGTANNGGCFDPSNIGATGVDYSTNTTAHVTVTTSMTTSGAGSTTITQGGGTWDNTLLGNCIHITAGTNFVQGFYVVTGFTDSNNLVLNVSASPAGAGSAGTGAIGGAIATVATAITGVAAGNTVYIKSTATYTSNVALNFATAGSSGLPISWIGYTSTDTDGGPAVIQATGTSINLFTGGSFQRFINLTIDCNSQASTRAASYAGSNVIWANVLVKNCATVSNGGLSISGSSHIIKHSVFTANAATALNFATIGHVIYACTFYANTSAPLVDGATTATGTNTYLHNLFVNNTGATTDGLDKTGAAGIVAHNNTFYGNGRDGFRISGAASADNVSFRENVIYGNTGTGLNVVATNWSAQTYWIDATSNGIGGNGTNRVNVPVGTRDVVLTSDPFTNGAGNVFSLNSTSGGGAALKAAGYPGIFGIGGTGYPDIGTLQSQCTGGAAVTRSCGQ